MPNFTEIGQTSLEKSVKKRYLFGPSRNFFVTDGQKRDYLSRVSQRARGATKNRPIGKCKVLPYSLLSVGPGADPGVQAVSLQVTLSHPPGGRLPLLSVRTAVTFPAEQRHRQSASTKLYCLMT